MTESTKARVQRKRVAARALGRLTGAERNALLLAAADAIEQRSREILAANAQDCDALAPEVAEGKVSHALADRLRTSPSGVKEIAGRVRDVAGL